MGDHNSISENKQLIVNTCNSEIIHTVNVFVSFAPIFFAIPFGELPVFIITFVLTGICDLRFVMLRRYNRPRKLQKQQRMR